MKFIQKSIPFIILCLLIPVSLNFFMYYGFVSTSPAKIYTIVQFEEHFSNNVLKHRILGKFLLLKINEVVSGIEIPLKANVFDRISTFIEAESLSLYHSFFILNTFFFCLTIIVLYLILNRKWVRLNITDKRLYLLLISAIIAVSQFIILPYDTLSYFFISIVVLLMLQGKNIWIIILTGVLIAIGTTARETIALTLSFYLLLIVKQKDYQFLTSFNNLVFFTACFVVPYTYIHWFAGLDGVFVGRVRFPSNIFAIQNLPGFLFIISITFIFLNDKFAGRAIALYLLFCSPYILIIFLTGIFFEIRLWIPVIIMMMVIYIISRSANSYSVDDFKKKRSTKSWLLFHHILITSILFQHQDLLSDI